MDHPDAVHHQYCTFDGDATRAPVTGTASQIGPLTPGMYVMHGDVDGLRFKQGVEEPEDTITTTTGNPVIEGMKFWVPVTKQYVQLIASDEDGTFEAMPVSGGG